MLRKIYRELRAIRNELHNIRNAMESRKIDTDAVAYDIAEKLKGTFSAMNL